MDDAQEAPSFDEGVRLLKALASEPRLAVMVLLMREPGAEFSVTELQQQIGYLGQSALSQHLARLRVVSVVKTRKVGPVVYYSINQESPAIRSIQALFG